MSAPLAPPPSYADTPTLLVKIFGKDRPGITAGLFDTLAGLRRGRRRHRAGRDPGPHRAVRAGHRPRAGTGTEGELRATVHSWAESMSMQAEIISGTGDNRPRGTGRSHVTVLGHPLTAESTAAIAASITDDRRQHRPHLPAREVPGDRRGVRRCRARRRRAAHRAGAGGRATRGGRGRGAVGAPAAGAAAGGDGRGLHAHPGRGHRAVRRPRGLRGRGRRGDGARRCAASWTSSSRCTPGCALLAGLDASVVDKVRDAGPADPRRAHAGPYPQAARLPGGRRLRAASPRSPTTSRSGSGWTSPPPTPWR